MIGICTCMQYHPREAMDLWRKRAAPILTRMIRHGHPVDLGRMNETLRLVCLLERDHPDCSAPENAHRSHHLPGCPVAPRTVGRIQRKPGEQRVHVDPRAVAEWATGVATFLGQPT